MQVNFKGSQDYSAAGPGYAAKSGAGKKVAAGIVVAAGVALVGLAAHKGGVLSAVKDQFTKAKEVEGFGKKFTTIFSKDHIVKGFKGIGEGFKSLKDSAVALVKKIMPKAKEEASEVAEEVQAAAEGIAQ